jgi:hypothetical protein
MMTRLCTLGLSLPLLLGAAQEAEWKAFKPREGNFSVLLPGKPKEQQQAVRTPSGTIDVNLYVAELKGGTFAVGYAEFPEQTVKPGTTGRRLDNARDGAVANAGGKLTKERRINLDRYPGREVHIEIDGKGNVLTRFYAVKNKLYQLVVLGSKDRVYSPDTEKFFDSFQLLPEKK